MDHTSDNVIIQGWLTLKLKRFLLASLFCFTLFLGCFRLAASGETLNTVKEFVQAFDHDASHAEKDFEQDVSIKLMDKLLQSGNDKEAALLEDIAVNCGVTRFPCIRMN